MAAIAAPPPPPAALPSDGLLLELLAGPPSPRTCVASDACLSLGSQGSPSSSQSRDEESSKLAAATDPCAPPAAAPADSTAPTSPESASQLTKQQILDLDPHRLAQRQKQIDFGKNTTGYQRYLQLVPRNKRRRTDPATPDIHANISKRRFDGQVVVWRRALHKYDDDAAQDASASASSASSSTAATVARQPQHSRSSRGSCSSYPSASSSYSYGAGGQGLVVVVPTSQPPPAILAECTSLASYSDAACGDGSTVLSVTASAGPSSPTSSCGGSRRSLDGYLEPQQHHHSHHAHSSRRRRTLMSEEGEEDDGESMGFRCEVLPRDRSGGAAKAAVTSGECRRRVSSSGGGSEATCGEVWAQAKQLSQGQRGQQQPGLSREQLQRLAEQHKHLAAAAAALVPVVVIAGDDDGGADPIVAYHPVYETEGGQRMVMTRGGAATIAPAAGAGEGPPLLALPVEVVYGGGAEILGFRNHREAVAAAPAASVAAAVGGAITFGVAVRASQAAAAQLDVGMGAGCSAVVVVEKPAARVSEEAAPAGGNAQLQPPGSAAVLVSEAEERALVHSLTSLLLR
ncbi:hypothetical protein HXX76_010209 [Chlamydomonas incerta]|uniref:Histone RNA hairpin-binding protein RNA-binding domain-containing protein n=1 Tax=Chlamydomonas incerta TaxID=51695 RepID=A0A835T0C6_CHLIN|nr:hypothetical protein HXX76_010209 [Chlamydomonas incerta]|eukprot:KAG2430110.1 hypothetical protein HXX76_010209 [Chlamydomonas incerta]